MGRRIGVTPPIVFTGGVAENIGVVREIADQVNIDVDNILIPEDPKIIGALGAALFALEEYKEKNNAHVLNSSRIQDMSEKWIE